MREKIPITNELPKDNYGFTELSRKSRETTNPQPEQTLPNKEVDIEKLTKRVKEHARSSSDILPNHTDHNPAFTTRHHRSSNTASSTLKQAQNTLSSPERQFSKIIHNSKVETISDAVGGTIARPSGLLWGGIFSLIGSVGVLLVCRYYGYEYNYLIGIASFAGGYFIGFLLEGLAKAMQRRPR